MEPLTGGRPTKQRRHVVLGPIQDIALIYQKSDFDLGSRWSAAGSRRAMLGRQSGFDAR
jgi:hypothetical protein